MEMLKYEQKRENIGKQDIHSHLKTIQKTAFNLYLT